MIIKNIQIDKYYKKTTQEFLISKVKTLDN